MFPARCANDGIGVGVQENIVTIAKFKGIIQRLEGEIIAARDAFPWDAFPPETSLSGNEGAQDMDATGPGGVAAPDMMVVEGGSEWQADIEGGASGTANTNPQSGGVWL